MFIKPPQVYRQAYAYSWVNTVAILQSILCMSTLVNSTQVMFRDYRKYSSISQANHNFPDFLIPPSFPWLMSNSLTFPSFPVSAHTTVLHDVWILNK